MILKNCKLVGGEIRDIRIKEGKIAKIEKDLEEEEEVLDVNGKFVIPGLLDPHCHFREPGLTHKEDFYTGSKAAAAGGFTTFLDMPNTNPPTISHTLLEEKRTLAKKSLINYGFHFGASSGNASVIESVRNVPSTKLFMNITTGDLLVDDEKEINKIFLASDIVSVHAEDEMVKKAIWFSKNTGKKLYLCHISTKEEIEVIKEEKNDKIFVEVTPHHLFLDSSLDNSNFTKMKPPLRDKKDRFSLWEAINSGVVDTIGTDHAPHTVEEKEREEIVFGVPGSETALPLMLNEVNKGNLNLSKVVELCCHKPATIFGIENKGFLKEGYDADITVIDIEKVKRVIGKDLFTKCKWSPFEGNELIGWPVMTIVNGNIVFNEGIINETNRGKEVVFNG